MSLNPMHVAQMPMILPALASAALAAATGQFC
jgi:hypothetical protein